MGGPSFFWCVITSIAVYSDLHVEHSSLSLNTTDADVVVLAGDIFAMGQAYSEDFSIIHWIDQNIPDTVVVFVPGNHDFEDSYWEKQMMVWKQHAQQLGGRIHVLWNESVDVQGIRFLGTPLFTDFASTGHPEVVKAQAKKIPDFNRIWNVSGHAVHPNDYVQWNHTARQFLSDELPKDPEIKKVVVTHFAPSLKLRNPNHPAALLDAYWLNDCEDLVAQADLWISGHSHYSCDLTLENGGRMISNARGVSKMYNLSSDPQFDRAFRVNIDACPVSKMKR